jgi:hypothetical protein
MAKGNAVIPNKFRPELYEGRYFKQVFPGPLPVGSAPNGYGDPTGATGDTNLLQFRGPFPADFGYHIKGAGQTLLAPSMDFTNGWFLAGLDVAVSEGVEYVPGSALALANPFGVKAGDVDYPGMFLRLRAHFATAANIGECALGWRKAEAYQANLDDYDELACLNIQYDTDAAYLRQETILNGAATVTTELGETVGDAEVFTLEAQMLGTRCRLLFNGLDVSGPIFNFDADEEVIPFIFWLQNATAGSVFAWYEVECGPLWLVERDGSRR